MSGYKFMFIFLLFSSSSYLLEAQKIDVILTPEYRMTPFDGHYFVKHSKTDEVFMLDSLGGLSETNFDDVRVALLGNRISDLCTVRIKNRIYLLNSAADTILGNNFIDNLPSTIVHQIQVVDSLVVFETPKALYYGNFYFNKLEKICDDCRLSAFYFEGYCRFVKDRKEYVYNLKTKKQFLARSATLSENAKYIVTSFYPKLKIVNLKNRAVNLKGLSKDALYKVEANAILVYNRLGKALLLNEFGSHTLKRPIVDIIEVNKDIIYACQSDKKYFRIDEKGNAINKERFNLIKKNYHFKRNYFDLSHFSYVKDSLAFLLNEKQDTIFKFMGKCQKVSEIYPGLYSITLDSVSYLVDAKGQEIVSKQKFTNNSKFRYFEYDQQGYIVYREMGTHKIFKSVGLERLYTKDGSFVFQKRYDGSSKINLPKDSEIMHHGIREYIPANWIIKINKSDVWRKEDPVLRYGFTNWFISNSKEVFLSGYNVHRKFPFQTNLFITVDRNTDLKGLIRVGQ